MLVHLADVSIRSFLLAFFGAIALWIVRERRTAALQHAVWTAVLCGMLALFAFGLALPRISLPVLEGRAALPEAAPRNVAAYPALPDATRYGTTTKLPHPIHAEPRRPVDWKEAAAYVYAVIAAAFLARFGTGVFLIRRVVAHSNAVRDFRESGSVAVPLTVGWLRPTILLPIEWREWEREKLEAVLAHEGAHVRRRDGLVAALAGVNRCIFWFHPLAWWLERKLALLAEQACDESSVAELGDRQRYAHLLLEMALVVDRSQGRLRHHALTMAACSHLRQRIDALLREGRTFSRGLSRAGWATVALCAIPLIWGAGAVELDQMPPAMKLELPRMAAPAPPVLLARAAPPAPPQVIRLEFEVASVKPSVMRPYSGGRSGGGFGCAESFKMDRSRVDIGCISLGLLIASAFRTPLYRVAGPDWLHDRGSTRFDVDAKIPDGASQDQVPEMLQALLADRFKLAVHRATTEEEVVGLVVAKGGLRVKEATPGTDASAPELDAQPATITELGGLQTRVTRIENADGRGTTTVRSNPRIGIMREMDRLDGTFRWEAPSITLAGLADVLDRVGPLPGGVVDLTGLKGRYQVILEVSLKNAFAAAEARRAASGDPSAPPEPLDMQHEVLKALNDGLWPLGLQLERRKAQAETLVVDHVEKTPTGN